MMDKNLPQVFVNASRGVSMKQQLSGAIQYWDYVAPVVKYPKNDKELNELISVLDGLLEIIGNDEKHHLIGLLDVISGLISSYEEENFSTPPAQKRYGGKL